MEDNSEGPGSTRNPAHASRVHLPGGRPGSPVEGGPQEQRGEGRAADGCLEGVGSGMWGILALDGEKCPERDRTLCAPL